MQLGKIVQLLAFKVPKIMPQLRFFDLDPGPKFDEKKKNPRLNISDYVSSMYRVYFMNKVIVKEVSALLLKLRMTDLDKVLRALDNSWTLVFDNLIDYSKQTQTKLTILETEKGVTTQGFTQTQLQELQGSLFGQKGILSKIIDENIKDLKSKKSLPL